MHFFFPNHGFGNLISKFSEIPHQNAKISSNNGKNDVNGRIPANMPTVLFTIFFPRHWSVRNFYSMFCPQPTIETIHSTPPISAFSLSAYLDETIDGNQPILIAWQRRQVEVSQVVPIVSCGFVPHMWTNVFHLLVCLPVIFYRSPDTIRFFNDIVKNVRNYSTDMTLFLSIEVIYNNWKTLRFDMGTSTEK